MANEGKEFNTQEGLGNGNFWTDTGAFNITGEEPTSNNPEGIQSIKNAAEKERYNAQQIYQKAKNDAEKNSITIIDQEKKVNAAKEEYYKNLEEINAKEDEKIKQYYLDEDKKALEKLAESQEPATEASEPASQTQEEPSTTGAVDERAQASANAVREAYNAKNVDKRAGLKNQEEINAAATGKETIARGDTMWKYATQTGHSITTLSLLNGIEDPNMILAGDTIDFGINKNEVTTASQNVNVFLETLNDAVNEFKDGVKEFGDGYKAKASNGEDLQTQIIEIEQETDSNISTISGDASNYADWLDRLVKALEYEEQNANDIWGNTDLLKTKDI